MQLQLWKKVAKGQDIDLVQRRPVILHLYNEQMKHGTQWIVIPIIRIMNNYMASQDQYKKESEYK